MHMYDNYGLKYPTLIIDIIEYFSLDNNPNDHSILKFCETTAIEENGQKKYIHQPEIIDRICKKLCDKNILSVLKTGSPLGLHNNYAAVIHDSAVWNASKECQQVYLNSLVYGFDYIYNLYKEIVIPLIWEKENGDYSVGTGFKLYGGIVTAKHCITDATNLQIKGFSAAELQQSKIYISTNPYLDIAFIDVGRKDDIKVFAEEGKILQDVLALGYPKIPAFTDFLTAEKATISSKAISRITPTKGAIAAVETNYLARTELMLITAKIRGGNSGGPVINEEGSVVGISCQLPNYEGEIGDYDDLGYGIVIPIKYLFEILSEKNKTLDVTENFFKEYVE